MKYQVNGTEEEPFASLMAGFAVIEDEFFFSTVGDKSKCSALDLTCEQLLLILKEMISSDSFLLHLSCSSLSCADSDTDMDNEGSVHLLPPITDHFRLQLNNVSNCVLTLKNFKLN